jgi:hypothetical protein
MTPEMANFSGTVHAASILTLLDQWRANGGYRAGSLVRWRAAMGRWRVLDDPIALPLACRLRRIAIRPAVASIESQPSTVAGHGQLPCKPLRRPRARG